MNRTLLVTLASLALALPAAAQSSSTPVIGFYKFNVPTGNSIWTSGFITKTEFQGAWTSVAPGANLPDGTPTTVITQTGATWGSFPLHYVEVLSTGSSQGLILDIVENTASTVRVRGAVSGSGLTYAVRKHATLSTVFAAGSGLVDGVDTVTLISSSGLRSTFSYNGSNWEDVGSLDDGSNYIIYPGQAFIIAAGAARTVTFGGGEVSYVKMSPTKIPLFKNVPNLIGLVNPLVSTDPGDPIYSTTAVTSLGSYDFVSQLVAGIDTVDVRALDGSLTSLGVFSSNGGNMEDVGSLDDGTTLKIRNGSGLVVSVPADRTYTAPAPAP